MLMEEILLSCGKINPDNENTINNTPSSHSVSTLDNESFVPNVNFDDLSDDEGTNASSLMSSLPATDFRRRDQRIKFGYEL